MNILSLDCSTRQPSAALLVDGDVCHEQCWTNELNQHEDVVARLESMRVKAGWRWDQIDLFIAGRGPGSYAGLRASLLAVQALAAPGNAAVMAVSSMDALALQLIEEQEQDAITLVGDARRQSLWIGQAGRHTLPAFAIAWRVIPALDADRELPSGMVATPHWESTAGLRHNTPGTNWLPGSRYPSAAGLARLALLRREQGASPESLLPLYLHAAVQTEST